MTESWAYAGAPPTVGNSTEPMQPLVEGSLFALGTPTGDLPTGGAHGLFFRDLRVLSRWEIRIDGQRLEPLAHEQHHPYAATYISRVPPPAGLADSHLLVLRHRYLGGGMREDVIVRNLGQETAGCVVTMLLDADFADLFAVKENRVQPHPDRITVATDTDGDEEGVRFSYRWLGHHRDVRVLSDAHPQQAPGVLTFTAAIPPRGQWRTRVQVTFTMDGRRHRAGLPPRRNRRAAPAHPTQPRVGRTRPRRHQRAPLARSRAAHRRTRPRRAAHPRPRAPGPGRGRRRRPLVHDHLRPRLAAHRLDGAPARPRPRRRARCTPSPATKAPRTDPLTEEQPGRILHEIRFGTDASLALGGGNVYYGSIDATPLFVMLLAEAHNWGLADDDLTALLPHADAALAWITEHGDADGDGFVEYQRATDRGLEHQGWKDSFDGINFADGQLAAPPIALCEVQGYVYAAYRARARLARHLGDPATAAHWSERGSSAQTGVQRDVLAARPRLLRRSARPDQAPRRRADLQHRPLPVDRHRRRRQGATQVVQHLLVRRHVHRLGHPHPRGIHGRLQPDELPQRIRLAARQRRSPSPA